MLIYILIITYIILNWKEINIEHDALLYHIIYPLILFKNNDINLSNIIKK